MTAEPEDPVAARSRFLASLSHEVRAPLNAIIGFSELLTDDAFGELNADQQAVARDIEHAARYLLRLINDILDISRLQLAKLDLDIDVLPLAAVVERALQIARGLAVDKRIALEAHVDPVLAVSADECRVLQILNNLLANAIHFSPPRTVVTVSAIADATHVWTLVRDCGPGIEFDDQERIFEAFVAVECGGVEPGAGLGLSVCRNLVHAMGGEITVESTPGEGATFRFGLPRVERPE